MSKRESRSKCALSNDCMQVVACSNEGIWKRIRGKQSLYTSNCLNTKNIGSNCVGSSHSIQVVACRQKNIGRKCVGSTHFMQVLGCRSKSGTWEQMCGEQSLYASTCWYVKHGTWERMRGKQSLHASACLHVKQGITGQACGKHSLYANAWL